jgi:ribosomal protein L7/L12
MGMTSLFVIIIAGLCGVVVVGSIIALGIIAVMNRVPRDRQPPTTNPDTSQASAPAGENNPAAGIPAIDSASLAAVEELVEKKQIINAIRLYREATGASLVDAKNAVEAIRNKISG